MSNHDLKRDPQHVGTNRGWWYYEEPKGIEVLTDSWGEIARFVIPWARIRAALARKDRKPRKRKAR